jgi:hypothetical protein
VIETELITSITKLLVLHNVLLSSLEITTTSIGKGLLASSQSIVVEACNPAAGGAGGRHNRWIDCRSKNIPK